MFQGPVHTAQSHKGLVYEAQSLQGTRPPVIRASASDGKDEA